MPHHSLKPKARVWGALVLALVMLGAVACGGTTSPKSSGTSPSSAAPTRGGTLTYLGSLEPRGLDPILTFQNVYEGAADSQVQAAIFDLLSYEDTASGAVVYRTAQSLTSQNAVVWTLTLRPNIKFSDGTPYDAAAVEFNWNRIDDPTNHALTAVNAIKSLTVVNPLTLTITLKAPNGQFPRVVAEDLAFIGSPTAIKSEGANFATAPVGAGPFLLKQWIRGSQITLVRNPNYWDAPRPYLDTIVYKIVGDQTQRLTTFLAGQADAGSLVVDGQGDQQVTAAGDQVLNVGTVSGAQILVFNMKTAPFNDVRWRTAVAEALNMNEVNNQLNGGTGKVLDTMFSPTSPFYDPQAKVVSYNPAAAQAAFNAYATEYGHPLNFSMTLAPISAAPGPAVQAQLASYKNVHMTITTVNSSDINVLIAQGNYQLATNAVLGIDPEPSYYNFFHSGTSYNLSGISNPALDTALDLGRASLTTPQRVAAYKTAQELINQLVPVVWLPQVQSSTIATKAVHIPNYAFFGAYFATAWKS